MAEPPIISVCSVSGVVVGSRLVLSVSPYVTPRIRCARCLPVIHRCCHVICLRVAFYHVIMCIALHTCSSHASEHFPRCPFCNPAFLCPPVFPFRLSLCAAIKLSRNGPRFAKRPWYSTGRPPVKFRAIWSSFGTPTVNRVTVKAPLSLQSNTPPKVAQNPSNFPPYSRSFDHNRVAKNRTSFGLS